MTFSGKSSARFEAAVAKALAGCGGNVAPGLNGILSDSGRRTSFLERLTAELTVGESYFFRNAEHFRTLREHVVPAIVQERGAQREMRIWSAGCAAGEEPYSLAILLDQLLPSTPRWQLHILATDLNAEFLETARAGRYRPWSFRQTNIHQDRRYFTQDGPNYCLAAFIRHSVRFAYLNLVKDIYPSPLTGTLGFDLILFRNVAIYLTRDVTRAIIQRFHSALRPGGWLLLGETEVASAPSDGFAVHRIGNATLLRKPGAGSPLRQGGLPTPANPATAILPPTSPAAVRRSPSPPPATANLPPPPPQESRTTQPPCGLLSHGDYAGAERTIDHVPARRERAAARWQYVRELLACGQIARARKMLEKCLDEDPLRIEAQLLKATFAEEDGRLAEAEQACRRALYVDRNCAIAHFHLALVQKQAGRLDAARRSLRIANALASSEDGNAPVPFGEGVCFGRLRELMEEILHL